MVSSKCVVSLRPTPSERHYCTDTARIPCDRQPTMSLSETDTSDNCLYCCLAVPLSGFGNVRVMPFCPPIPPLPLINCFTISLLLYKRQFLSTQAYCMWQTGLLRPICLSVLRQGQGTFVMLTRVPDLSVTQPTHEARAELSSLRLCLARRRKAKPTVSSYLIYVTIYLLIILLRPTP